MPSKLSRSKIVKKKLDTIFSQYIRLKDADHNGDVTCFTCGKVSHYKSGMQCGHFQSRKTLCYKMARNERSGTMCWL